MSARSGSLHGRRGRRLAGVVVGALVASLLPLAALALQPNEVEDPEDACPEDVNPPAPFVDRMDIPSVHRLNVDCAFNYNITNGFGDQTFRPRVTVRRDQFASFMVRTMQAADVDLPEPSDQGFTDVRGNVHEDNINIIAQTGITVGRTATRYEPRLRLRRDQIASMVLRAAAFIEDVPLERIQRETGPFTDVPAGNIHRRNINGARDLNLTIGRTAGTYEPGTLTRRDQMASFLVRLWASLSEGPIVRPEDRVETLELNPPTATNQVGTQHTMSATVRDNEGQPVSDANVHFEVYRDAEGDGTFAGPVAAHDERSDAQGQSGFAYTGPGDPAQDVIVACVAFEGDDCQVTDEDDTASGTQFSDQFTVGARVSDSAAKTWARQPVVRIDIDEDDLDAVNPPGETHTVTATAVAQDDGRVAGAPIRFEVYRDDADTPGGTFSGPVEDETLTTDANGQVTFSYVHGAPAEDRIVVCVPGDDGTCEVTDEDTDTAATQFTGDPTVGAEPHAVATKRWQVPVDRIVFDDDDLDATNPWGTDHAVTVTALDADNEPVADATVRFEVYRKTDGTFSGPVAEETTTTGDDGRASFTYAGPEDAAAEDRIVVCVPGDDGTCEVTDEDTDTAGTQFTGEPTVGAEPHAVAVKRWVAPVAAESLTARAYGLNVELLGETLIDREPEVSISLPEPRQEEVADELLEVPASPLTEVGALRVAARGDLDRGFAQAEAEAADVELLPDAADGEPLITADAIRAVSTSTCPEQGSESTASAGSEFVNLTIAGEEIPLTPPPNTDITIPGVAQVVVREVIPDATTTDSFGWTVRGLRVTLLDGTGGEIIVGEAHSSVVCVADVVAAGTTTTGTSPTGPQQATAGLLALAVAVVPSLRRRRPAPMPPGRDAV